MGIAISYISLPFIYIINKFTKINESINGNWLTYLYLSYQFLLKRKFSKGRFELYNPDIDGDPHAIGLLPFNEEWDFECPNRKKAENLFVYGTNTWGQYLLINIKWRPQKDNTINAFVNFVFKDENGFVYELNQNDLLEIKSNETLKEYRIAGLTIEVLSPFRKLRIKVRAYLTRKDTNELIYTRFRLFWSPLSNVFDFKNDFNHQFIVKEFSALGVSSVKLEDRHEQWGQISGTIQFENEKSRELFLWGNKAKQYLCNNEEKRRITRVYGMSTKGFSFHIGALTDTDNNRSRYGYMHFGTGAVYPITSISSSFNQIESMGTSLTKFKIDMQTENRSFDVEIEQLHDRYSHISICDLKLNGHKGKCVVIYETQDEDIVSSPVTQIISENVASDLVLLISDPKSRNVSCSGGKGSSLGSLYQLSQDSGAKFVVPRGLIVTSNSYETLLNDSELLQNEIERLEKITWSETREGLQKCCKSVSENFGKQKLPQIIQNQIKTNLISIFGENYDSIHFAVRSSASGEDSEEMSAAGQMTTFLGVKGIDEISSAIMKCWSSQFSYVCVEYKRGYGQEINTPMAVVIQEMVNCDSAGVIFTCDPLTGDERKLIITANYGIGESVVSAISEPDTITLNVNIETNCLQKQRTIKGIESIQIGSKLKSITLNNNNESGTIEINTSNSDDCCLTESQCLSLGNIALEVHKYYGNPRDIEWGIINNKMYLLQSRPITNLDNWSEWELMYDMDSGQQSEKEYFSRSNLGEVFPGASSHMCLSWLINCWNGNGFRQWKKMFNLTNKEFSPYFNRGGGTVSNHYFFLLKTGSFPFIGDPKSTFSKSIQVGIFGHYFDDEEMFNDSNEKAPKKIRSTYSKIKGTLELIYYFLTPGIRLRKAKETIKKNFNLFDGRNCFTAKDVFTVISETTHMNYPATYAHGNVTMSSMIYNMVLLNMLKSDTSDTDTQTDNSYTDFAQLLSCANEVVSAEVPNFLRDIANAIQNRQQFRSMSDEKALKYLLSGDSKASIKFKEFLVKYGHRGYKEFDPLALQWADNPISVIKSLRTMITGNLLLTQSKQIKSIDDTISSLKTPLSTTKKFLLKYMIIPWCQSAVGLREQGKHLLTWTINEYRRVFWRLARLMVSEGRLPEADLLFHMTFPELQTLINERDPKIVVRARMRKRLHETKDKMKFSETSIGPNFKPRDEIKSLSECNGVPNGEIARIKGIPVSVGKIKARCCVAMTLEEAQNIQSGDILITYSTDIGWSPYFPMLSGLATEIGGLISHGAVIAREYGLPCLVGVEGASHLFRTGDIILLDSELGEIIKIN